MIGTKARMTVRSICDLYYSLRAVAQYFFLVQFASKQVYFIFLVPVQILSEHLIWSIVYAIVETNMLTEKFFDDFL